MISSEKRKILSHRKAHVWFRTLLFPVSIAAFAQLWDDSSRCHAEVSMLSLKTFNQSTRWCVRTFRAERSFTAAELQLVTVHTNLWAVGCRHRDMLSSIIAHFSSEQLVSLRLDSSNYQESVWSSVSQPGHTLSHCYCYPIGWQSLHPMEPIAEPVTCACGHRGGALPVEIRWVILAFDWSIPTSELYQCDAAIRLHVLLIRASTNLPQEALNLCKISKIWELGRVGV